MPGRYGPDHGGVEVNPNRRAVLAAIVATPGANQTRIGEALGITRARVGQIVASLSADKLVEKAEGAIAGYGRYQATAEGRAVIFPEAAP